MLQSKEPKPEYKPTKPDLRAQQDRTTKHPSKPLHIQIMQRERLFLAGKTGTGKTTLVSTVLKSASDSKQWVILDPKHDTVIEGIDAPIVEEFHENEPHQIIRVPIDKMELDRWDEAIDGVFWRGNSILYVDEVHLINPNSVTLRPSLGRAIRAGRNRGIGVWSATQRPKFIPGSIYTEAEHFAIFRLTYWPDIEKVISFTNERLEASLLRVRGHDFVYWNEPKEIGRLVHQ